MEKQIQIQNRFVTRRLVQAKKPESVINSTIYCVRTKTVNYDQSIFTDEFAQRCYLLFS